MTDRVVDVVHSGDGGSSGALMAVAVVLLIAVLMLVLYFTGVFGRNQKKDIDVDVNINKPGVVLLVR
jgi:hypothetical protein